MPAPTSKKGSPNPWQTLSSREVYENPWISVREDRVINPAGGEGIYGVVGFKNLAIGVIPLDKELNTWLVGQHRYPLEEYSWEIPMGGCPLGTDILSSAKRELREETGLTAETWTEIMRAHTSNSVTNEVGYVFLAEGLTKGPPDFEETEDLSIMKLPFSEACRMVMDQEITDLLSVAGLLNLARRLER